MGWVINVENISVKTQSGYLFRQDWAGNINAETQSGYLCPQNETLLGNIVF